MASTYNHLNVCYQVKGGKNTSNEATNKILFDVKNKLWNDQDYKRNKHDMQKSSTKSKIFFGSNSIWKNEPNCDCTGSCSQPHDLRIIVNTKKSCMVSYSNSKHVEPEIVQGIAFITSAAHYCTIRTAPCDKYKEENNWIKK